MRPGRAADHSRPSNAVVMELYPPSGPHRACNGIYLPFIIVFLATCFGSYTEPSSGWSSEWFVCTVVGALKVTRSRITNSS